MPPPILGTSRWATTAPSDEPSWTRIWSCLQAGKTSMMRSIACAESLVCRVEKTRWPGLGQRQGELDGLEVAHLTDQQDVGVLAQRRAQRPLEGWAVGPDLALRDRRHPVGVHVLDRVLDREDVHGPGLVDAVDDGGQRRRLSGSGRTRLGGPSPGGAGRATRRSEEPELVEGRDVRGNHAKCERDVTLLGERAATDREPDRSKRTRSRRPGAR